MFLMPLCVFLKKFWYIHCCQKASSMEMAGKSCVVTMVTKSNLGRVDRKHESVRINGIESLKSTGHFERIKEISQWTYSDLLEENN